jgi:hypothetical protein
MAFAAVSKGTALKGDRQLLPQVPAQAAVVDCVQIMRCQQSMPLSRIQTHDRCLSIRTGGGFERLWLAARG